MKQLRYNFNYYLGGNIRSKQARQLTKEGIKEGGNLPFYNYSKNVIAQSCFIGGCGNEDIILKELPS
jgi:hypothetical protein